MATEPSARPTPTLRREAQAAMYRRALRAMPGGTDSNCRAWGDATIYVDRGKGALVWDVDEGRRSAGVGEGVITAIAEGGYGARPFRRIVGADTFTPLAGAAFLVIPSEDEIVAAATDLA